MIILDETPDTAFENVEELSQLREEEEEEEDLEEEEEEEVVTG
jgi:hypothetical protein